MRRISMWMLVAFLALGNPISHPPAFAQDEAPPAENTETPPDQIAPPETSSPEGTGENRESGNSDSGSSSGEAKTYVCSKCGFSSDSQGDCPACNVSLQEDRGQGAPPPEGSESSSGDGTSSDSPKDSDSSAPRENDQSETPPTSEPPADQPVSESGE
ncbi:MAG: hypothetical protein WA705_17625 [Candidatus Ozemobacteraceae bacterium]